MVDRELPFSTTAKMQRYLLQHVPSQATPVLWCHTVRMAKFQTHDAAYGDANELNIFSYLSSK
jgi:hypothetical protein